MSLDAVKRFLAKQQHQPSESSKLTKLEEKDDGSLLKSSDGSAASSDESTLPIPPAPSAESCSSSEPKEPDGSPSSKPESEPIEKCPSGSSLTESVKALLAEKKKTWSSRELEIKAGFAALHELQDADGRTTRYGDKTIRLAAYEICLKYNITHLAYIVMFCLRKYEDAPATHPFEIGRQAFGIKPDFECDEPKSDDDYSHCFFAGFHHERRKNPAFAKERDAS